MDLSLRKSIQVIPCQCITSRTKGNANYTSMLSHLEKKHVGIFLFFIFLLQIGNEKKYKEHKYIKKRSTSFN